ncbi:hypothetical protein [Altererythrobacter litoralis]|uniref:Uncharacterized protein n=1 Tax=Altererythrobacter litoralis TaxID=3113904 RepID=A0ABU7GHI0_9SPHN|nr:hypothetical protein [Erythrobacteraceae bacterium 1XM1-14]
MSFILIAAAIGLAAQATAPVVPATPPAAPLSQENKALVRCSAAFALVSFGQESGNAEAQKWPATDPRGREFFVRALAQVMDETGLQRDAVAGLVQAEAQRLLDEAQVDAVMPACLTMLEASGV